MTEASSTRFSALLAQLAPRAESQSALISDDWLQGRTTYGGLSAALCLAAAEHRLADLPPLRSAQFTFVGPVSGAVDAEVLELRRGRSSVVVGVDLRHDGAVATRAVLVFGAHRPTDPDYLDLPRPTDVPPPDACVPFNLEALGLRFHHHFDIRVAAGMPLSGAEKAENLIWMRHRDEAHGNSMAALIALADLPPPAALAVRRAPERLSTMSWMLTVLRDPSEVAPGWALSRSTAEHLSGGYSAQTMALWDADGQPVLSGRQSVALFA